MRTGTPLTGLLSDVPRAPTKWDKYDLFHDALKASADTQPVRAQRFSTCNTILCRAHSLVTLICSFPELCLLPTRRTVAIASPLGADSRADARWQPHPGCQPTALDHHMFHAVRRRTRRSTQCGRCSMLRRSAVSLATTSSARFCTA